MKSVVYLQKKNGSKPKGQRVVLSIAGVLSGGMTKAVYSNSDGVAVIQHSSKGKAELYVNRKSHGTMRVPGEKYIFID